MSDYREIAFKKAEANLKRVAKNLGAALCSYECATISIRGYRYIISPQRITRQNERGESQSTCLQQHPMPMPEMVAATLLLLCNDPTIFERWRRQDGWYS
jgi:hypothetical protein